MPLSSDPDKRAKQIANLGKGGDAAAEKHGLKVVPYADPPAEPTPAAPRDTPHRPAAERQPRRGPLGSFWDGFLGR